MSWTWRLPFLLKKVVCFFLLRRFFYLCIYVKCLAIPKPETISDGTLETSQINSVFCMLIHVNILLFIEHIQQTAWSCQTGILSCFDMHPIFKFSGKKSPVPQKKKGKGMSVEMSYFNVINQSVVGTYSCKSAQDCRESLILAYVLAMSTREANNGINITYHACNKND